MAISGFYTTVSGVSWEEFTFSSFQELKEELTQEEYYKEELESIFFDDINDSDDTSCEDLFNGCSSLTTVLEFNIESQPITSVKNMFRGCTSLESIQFNAYDCADLKDASGMFYGCSSLNNLDEFSFKDTTPTNISYMFYGCSSLSNIDLTYYDFSQVTNASHLFEGCASLNDLEIDEEIFSDSLTDMSYMFSNCSSLEDLGRFEFFSSSSNVTDMSYMFNNCEELKVLELDLDFSQVQNTSYMFKNCSLLRVLQLPYGNTISNVQNLKGMFQGCLNLSEIDTPALPLDNATDVSYMFAETGDLDSSFGKITMGNSISRSINAEGMFKQSYLTGIDLSGFKAKNLITNTKEMFYGCKYLTRIFCDDDWNLSSLIDSTNMFKDCEHLIGAIEYDRHAANDKTLANKTTGYFSKTGSLLCNYTLTGDGATHYYLMAQSFPEIKMTLTNNDSYKTLLNSIKISGYSSVTKDSCEGLFNGDSKLTSVDLSELYTEWSSSTFSTYITSTKNMFCDCVKLSTISFGTTFKTSRVTDMSYMFYNCCVLSLDLSNFNTSSVTDMKYMFYHCLVENLDLSNFNTSSVIDMEGMFWNAYLLKSLNVSSFDTSNVRDMSYMFYGCGSFYLTSLNVSNFKTSNVTNMAGMFCGCGVLTSLDLSNFDTSNVVNMSLMFENNEDLTSLNVTSFNTSNVTNMASMFNFCKVLTSIDVSNFDTSKVVDMSLMFACCYNLTNLNLTNFTVGENEETTTNIEGMFSYCLSLKTIYCSDSWEQKNVTGEDVFKNCQVLQGEISYDSSKINYVYANPVYGYFTEKDQPYYLLKLEGFSKTPVEILDISMNNFSGDLNYDCSEFSADYPYIKVFYPYHVAGFILDVENNPNWSITEDGITNFVITYTWDELTENWSKYSTQYFKQVTQLDLAEIYYYKIGGITVQRVITGTQPEIYSDPKDEIFNIKYSSTELM